jgi:hypothetical protein
LDFGTCLTFPSNKNDTSLIEGFQRRATKCIAGLRDLPYNERRMQLPTLVFRRHRCDMMLTYKYNAQPNNPLFTKHSSQRHTRGHSQKLSFVLSIHERGNTSSPSVLSTNGISFKLKRRLHPRLRPSSPDWTRNGMTSHGNMSGTTRPTQLPTDANYIIMSVLLGG